MKTLHVIPVGLTLLVGCQTLFTTTPKEPPPALDTPAEAKTATQPLAATATEFVRKYEAAQQANDADLNADRVRRYPDQALAALRASGDSPTLRQLAQQYDAAFGSAWQAALADRAKRADEYRTFDQQRAAHLQAISKGDFANAATLNLVRHVPSAAPEVVRLDALQLHAIALLQVNRTDDVLVLLRDSLKSPTKHQTVELHLLYADALRRAGKQTMAEEVWQRACGQLVSADEPVCDPALWERVAAQRPVRVPWPTEVHTKLAAFGGLPETATNVEGRPQENWTGEIGVWAGIGRMWLERHEGEPAVLAFKRVEAIASDDISKARLRVAQGEAMVLVGQTHAANTILLPLLNHSDKVTSSQALALVGAVRLAQGYANQGRKFLEEALQQGASTNWIGHSDAEANLGLAYLMLGDETKGYATLQQAEASFTKAKHIGRLRQLQDNMAVYQQNKSKPPTTSRQAHQMRE